MKRSNLSKVFAASILASSLAVLPITLPASAQTGSGTGSSSGAGSYNSAPSGTANNDAGYSNGGDHHDHGGYWGLFGLVGLLGLAGMGRKRAATTTAYRNPDEVSSGTYRR
jgi:uncharacterized membrane protein